MSPLVKTVLLVLAAISLRIAVNPPNPPPTTKDRVYYTKPLFERIIPLLCAFIQIVGIGSLMIESAMLLALHISYPQASRMFSGICPSPSLSLDNLSTISPLFMLGVGLMYASATLRLWCYKTLGSLFTFEVTIRPDHKLITSGPYAFVRHPSYTGTTIMYIGAPLAVFCAGSYVYECRIMSTPAAGILVAWLAVLGYTVAALLGRGEVEDEGLRKEFGTSWDNYSRSVPCRFIPGLV